MKNYTKALLSFVLIALMAACNPSDHSSDSNKNNTSDTAKFRAALESSLKKGGVNLVINKDGKDTTIKVPSANVKIPSDNETPDPNAKFDLKISQNADGSWGYSIWRVGDNHAYINQPHKPGVSGTRGFNTKEQATTVGNFVIDKIKKNAGMPMVTTKELDSLGALK